MVAVEELALRATVAKLLSNKEASIVAAATFIASVWKFKTETFSTPLKVIALTLVVVLPPATLAPVIERVNWSVPAPALMTSPACAVVPVPFWATTTPEKVSLPVTLFVPAEPTSEELSAPVVSGQVTCWRKALIKKAFLLFLIHKLAVTHQQPISDLFLGGAFDPV
jgi:hypothetical protein